MEFISTDEYFILQPLQKGENNLWISRVTGENFLYYLHCVYLTIIELKFV